MKNIVISADGPRKVYSVPDEVADNLSQYCLTFCTTWMRNSPHGQKYRTQHGWCYNEDDFIAYLNQWIFPKQQSVLVQNLGWIDFDEKLPAPYTDCPAFNF